MYTTVPLSATANWANPIPLTGTSPAISTCCPVTRPDAGSNGAAAITLSGRT